MTCSPCRRGNVGIAIGDVAGSGLHAAVVMGRIRSALRAYAMEADDPADVLTRLDRKVQRFEPDAMATVLYAVFDADLSNMTLSSAGHLPPIIVTDGAPGNPLSLAQIYRWGPSERSAAQHPHLPWAAGNQYSCIRTASSNAGTARSAPALRKLAAALTYGPADTCVPRPARLLHNQAARTTSRGFRQTHLTRSSPAFARSASVDGP